ncbi:MAG: hypothetical protein WCS37_15300, partial [Chloroflexota bacterium]
YPNQAQYPNQSYPNQGQYPNQAQYPNQGYPNQNSNWNPAPIPAQSGNNLSIQIPLDLSKLHTAYIAPTITGLLLLISVFLPWFTTNGYIQLTVNGFQDISLFDSGQKVNVGLYVLFLSIGIIILSAAGLFLGKKLFAQLIALLSFLSLIILGILLVYVLVKLIERGNNGFSAFSIGFGLIMAIVMAFATMLISNQLAKKLK